ncbi:MAG TPA: preprotein translocase subunit SecG, partial [Spirochaetia bacterium]|nr:preprotein translocase subunit SecG [Spirochaetia bacterium]
MALISVVLLVILVISAVLLVLVVLVQDEQGEGIGGIFGGGSNTAFGSRSGNVLTRFTAVLAAVFLVCVFGVAWINRTPSPGNVIGRARQQALGTTEQQSWWVQTTPAPGGIAAPGATLPGTPGAVPAPAGKTTAAPGTTNTALPAGSSTRTPTGTAPAAGAKT